jgi:hypothetical protein
LGCGPGPLSILDAPFVAEVVAIDPEPDMLAEGQRRARAQGISNVSFFLASSDDLPALHGSLGRFRSALMGQSFHWMVDKDRVLANLSPMIAETGGSVVFISPKRISIPEVLQTAHKKVEAILERMLADVPPGPHPRGRHDLFEVILVRSPFPVIEKLEREYLAAEVPNVAALLGVQYGISHVLTRLGKQRQAFESEVHAALDGIESSGEVWVTKRDEALIGRRKNGIS